MRWEDNQIKHTEVYDKSPSSNGKRRIQVRQSGIHGKGFFAVHPIDAGETLWARRHIHLGSGSVSPRLTRAAGMPPRRLYGELLIEDEKLRRFLDKRFNRQPPHAAVSDIHIERTREELKIIVQDRPSGVW